MSKLGYVRLIRFAPMRGSAAMNSKLPQYALDLAVNDRSVELFHVLP
jgi:hypothetical protein